MMIKYLSSSDAARLLGVTPATVRLMVRRGELSVAAKSESGIRFFRRKDVERLAENRAKRKGVSGAP